jgi:hypothetical protein
MSGVQDSQPQKTWPVIRQMIEPRRMERVPGFVVRRVLANAPAIGPFALMDHYGPVEFGAGQGLDVGPHPHAGMATLSYLFEGAILTRDSLGNAFTVKPGGAAFMMSGRGAAHSERTPPEMRQQPSRLAGLQLWVVPPLEREQDQPFVSYYDTQTLPVFTRDGITFRVIAGNFRGVTSPMPVLSPTFLVHAKLPAGAMLSLPAGEYEERGVYVVEGDVRVSGEPLPTERMGFLSKIQDAELTAHSPAEVILLGGMSLSPRHMWSTVLASKMELVEQAKANWAEGRILSVAGETERGDFPE